MSDYKQQISFDDPRFINWFKDIIHENVQKELKKVKFDNHYPAKIVINNGDGTANIKLMGSENIIPNVKIRQGLSVATGWECYVLAIGNSLNNIIIDFIK